MPAVLAAYVSMRKMSDRKSLGKSKYSKYSVVEFFCQPGGLESKRQEELMRVNKK